MSTRDRALELDVLSTAERHATGDAGPWTERVLERVDRHGAHVGRDLPDHLSLDAILAELQEEALDLGGWTIMALQVVRAHGVPDDLVEHLRERLVVIASLGATADLILASIRTEHALNGRLHATATQGHR